MNESMIMKSMFPGVILCVLAVGLASAPLRAHETGSPTPRLQVSYASGAKPSDANSNAARDATKLLPACLPRHKPSTCDWSRLRERP